MWHKNDNFRVKKCCRFVKAYIFGFMTALISFHNSRLQFSIRVPIDSIRVFRPLWTLESYSYVRFVILKLHRTLRLYRSLMTYINR